MEQLRGIHILLDTSGYAPESDFRLVATKCSLIYFDLKVMDPAMHFRYTGVDNSPILHNLLELSTLQMPFVVRVPLVAGVTDTRMNLSSIEHFVRNLKGLDRVELLPYNRAAGGKYAALGKNFQLSFSETQPINADLGPFERAGVPARIAGRIAVLPTEPSS